MSQTSSFSFNSLSMDLLSTSTDFITLKLKTKTANRSLNSSPYFTRSLCDTCAMITEHKLAHCTFECSSCDKTMIIENQPDEAPEVEIEDEIAEAQSDSLRSSPPRLSKERAIEKVWSPILKRERERYVSSKFPAEDAEPSMKRSKNAQVEISVSGIIHVCSLCPLKTSSRNAFVKHLMTRKHMLNVRKYKKSLNSQPILA